MEINLTDILVYGVFALICYMLAIVINGNRQRLLQYATDLIQKAETAVQGSGMGEEKKALVIAQLEAAGIRVNAWLEDQIDIIVASLNATGAWLATQTKQGISGLNKEHGNV